ncbi:MAG: calcium-binding protein, partial [bacterium]
MTNGINSNYLICAFCGASLSINDKTCNACEKNLYHTDANPSKDNIDDKSFKKYNKSDSAIETVSNQQKIANNVTFKRSVSDINLGQVKEKSESSKDIYKILDQKELNFKVESDMNINENKSEESTLGQVNSEINQDKAKENKADNLIVNLNVVQATQPNQQQDVSKAIDTLNINNTSNIKFDNFNDVNIKKVIDEVKETLKTIYGTEVNDEIIFKALQVVIYGLNGNDILTSGDFNDIIYGGGGNDTIDGGLGTNTLFGGTGNDTFIVNNLSDLIVEYLNEGTDLVKSIVSFILGANLENLTLLGQSNINGTGNSLDNIIIGNSGNNILSGNEGNDTLDGGAGADTMIGGAGDDTYTVDNVNDVVTEALNEGTDTVNSSISYSLGNNVENLNLTGNANIDGTGNALNNVITGNAGDNVLNGGVGADTMIGGAGDDTYTVDN